jgi:hypothetical protein
MLVENVDIVVYGEQQLIFNFSIIFVILTSNVIVIQILIEVHNNQLQNILSFDYICSQP